MDIQTTIETGVNNSLDRRASLDTIEKSGIQLKAAGAEAAAVDDYVNFRKAQIEASETARIEESKKMPLSTFNMLGGKEKAAFIAKGGQLKDE